MSEEKVIGLRAPAFPTSCGAHDIRDCGCSSGLTKREWFAGMAMQGILSNPVLIGALAQATNDPEKGLGAVSQMAKSQADLMLKELSK